VIDQLGEWGQRWTQRFDPDDLDVSLLMWDIQRRLVLDRLPDTQTVIRFDFSGVPRRHAARRTWWLVIRRPEVDLCLRDPGFPVSLVMKADLAALAKVWMGDVALAEAMRAGLVALEGPRELVRAMPDWLGLSHFAGVVHPVRARPAAPPGRGA
jgi:hypothetical protein